MADEVYYPETIEDQALPNTGSVNVPAMSQGSNPYGQETSKPLTDLDQRFPSRIIAAETVSKSLDTRTKRIKDGFTFAKHGAIRIGEYVNGVSGEIAITPNGLTALNVNGEQTLAIDGATGDATFKGVVQAGSFIAGDSAVKIEGDANNGRIVVFTSGVPSVVIGNV